MESTKLVLEVLRGGEILPETRSLLFADGRLWYEWWKRKRTLPGGNEMSPEEVARSLGVSPVRFTRSWRTLVEGIDEHSTNDSGRRWIFGTNEQQLEAVWTVGPDGDYWQTEYPVKTEADLDTLIDWLESRRFESYGGLYDEASADDDVLNVIALPSRPFAWLMLEILGWSEGLLLLMDAEEKIRHALSIAEKQVDQIVESICNDQIPRVLLSPDNLDAHFVSPGYFDTYLAESYT